jgi:hypothetical protein
VCVLAGDVAVSRMRDGHLAGVLREGLSRMPVQVRNPPGSATDRAGILVSAGRSGGTPPS